MRSPVRLITYTPVTGCNQDTFLQDNEHPKLDKEKRGGQVHGDEDRVQSKT